MSTKRKGKVAQLPKTLREELNTRLDDGATYPEIIDWLAGQGYPDFNEANLSRWKQGGYLDWLNAQERREQHEFIHELAADQAKTGDPTFHDAGVYIAQSQFYQALNRLDAADLAELVKENRKEFIQLLKTFTHFNRYCLQRDKFRNEVQQAEKAKHSGSQPAGEPITDPNLEIICGQLGLK